MVVEGGGEDSVEVDGAGAGSVVVVVVVELEGVGSEDVEVDVDPPEEVVALSDIHHPPLSDIQWYPEGQEPLLDPPPDDEEVDVLPLSDWRQVQALESKYHPDPQLDAETLAHPDDEEVVLPEE